MIIFNSLKHKYNFTTITHSPMNMIGKSNCTATDLIIYICKLESNAAVFDFDLLLLKCLMQFACATFYFSRDVLIHDFLGFLLNPEILI